MKLATASIALAILKQYIMFSSLYRSIITCLNKVQIDVESVSKQTQIIISMSLDGNLPCFILIRVQKQHIDTNGFVN